jgi:hypothetical protein
MGFEGELGEDIVDCMFCEMETAMEGMGMIFY